MATSSAFSDRLCIATEGEFNQLVSADELTFCCKSCGYGCYGGYPIKAWRYFNIRGLVTGGKYNTKDVSFQRAYYRLTRAKNMWPGPIHQFFS